MLSSSLRITLFLELSLGQDPSTRQASGDFFANSYGTNFFFLSLSLLEEKSIAGMFPPVQKNWVRPYKKAHHSILLIGNWIYPYSTSSQQYAICCDDVRDRDILLLAFVALLDLDRSVLKQDSFLRRNLVLLALELDNLAPSLLFWGSILALL